MSLIGDKTYKKFIDTGKIPDRIIYSISIKIMKGLELSEREETVFYTKTGEINEMIVHLSKK
jgi:hypothetical protein